MNIEIKYCRDVPKLRIWSKSAAAFDLHAGEAFETVKKGMIYGVGTGVMLAIPRGYCGLIFERSSLNARGLGLCNKVGVIDADYRGELILNLIALEDGKIDKNDRLAQLLIVPAITDIVFHEVDKLPKTARGQGAFGSTNAKGK